VQLLLAARRRSGSRRSAVARTLLALAFALVFACAVDAQPLSGGEEHLAADRPEAWAMNYFAATTLFTAYGEVAARAPWQWDLATDLGHIPRLNDRERRVGLFGTKFEDLNKSPVFGRLRLTVGLPQDWLAEFAYTPLIARDPWSVAVRALGQHGSIRGDVTCPARLANVADPVSNPYNCQAASNDRFGLNYYGADLTAGLRTGAWRLFGSAGLVRTDLDVQVDALTGGVRDRSHLFSRSWLHFFTLGARYEVDPKWSVATELLYVPLHVRRGQGAARETDSLASLRLQLRYRFN
jgi:hypothetical protein